MAADSTRWRPTCISATRFAFGGGPTGSRGSHWTARYATRSSTGAVAREPPPDGSPRRHPGGRKRNPALATLPREVTEALARPPRPELAAAIDLRASAAADRERLRRHRAVAGGKHPGAAAPARRRTLHHRAGAARDGLGAGAGRASHRRARSCRDPALGPCRPLPRTRRRGGSRNTRGGSGLGGAKTLAGDGRPA